MDCPFLAWVYIGSKLLGIASLMDVFYPTFEIGDRGTPRGTMICGASKRVFVKGWHQCMERSVFD